VPDGRSHIKEFQMSENFISPGKSSRFGVSPVLLIRASSIVFAGLMIGHLSGYPWSSNDVDQQIKLVRLMKSVNFVFAGERQTYWGLYLGWGVLVALLLLTIAIILWLVSDLARLAPRRVGAITGVVSAISLIGCYISYRFFYIPPAVFFAVLCGVLLAATVQLLGGERAMHERPAAVKAISVP
jgi:hypothetical protein